MTERSDFDLQREPHLPDDEWLRRFIAYLVEHGSKVAAPGFDVAAHAAETAPTYLPDRRDYVCPEEAASTDISYWEGE